MPRHPISINDIFVDHLLNDMTMLDGAGTDNEGQPLIKLRDAQKAIVERYTEVKKFTKWYLAKSIILKIPGIREITLNFRLFCFFFGGLSFIGMFVELYCFNTLMTVSNVKYFELVPVITNLLNLVTIFSGMLWGLAMVGMKEEIS